MFKFANIREFCVETSIPGFQPSFKPAMVSCKVKYDNTISGVLCGGQILSGVVELYNDRSRMIHGLSLSVGGRAEVSD